MSVTAAAHLLTRNTHRRRGASPLVFADPLEIERARAHEVCGPARRTLALAIAGRLTGPVLWIRPAWDPGRLNPEGMAGLADPSRLLFVTPKRAEDLLWSAEEGLRAGIVTLVVADLPEPPGLTAVRRLHLAAETGAEEGTVAPICLLLTPGRGGAAGVESRWALAGRHGAGGREAWKLDRRRARTQPEKSWTVVRGEGGGLALSPDPSVPREEPGEQRGDRR